MAKTVTRCKDCEYRRAQLFGDSITHYVESRPITHPNSEYYCAKSWFVVSDDDGCTFGSLRDDAD